MRRAEGRRDGPPDDGPWWGRAAVYEVFVRSFADSNGDGVGDLAGVRSRLGYLELLGVDALWLTPVTPSPMVDAGYDVADPRGVDPLFGDLEAFDALVSDAHAHGLRVLVDLVLDSTSDLHPWFRAALAARPGSPERARYHFRDGTGPDGAEPPNGWVSTFGGPAWTRVASTGPDDPGQWYLHLLAPEEPDLDGDAPDVRTDLERTVRFWLDHGVDGFRVGVAHGAVQPPGPLGGTGDGAGDGERDDAADGGGPRADARPAADGVHDLHRVLRTVLDEHPGAVAVGEVWLTDDEAFARSVRPDELHLAVTLRLVEAAFDADAVREAIERALDAVAAVGAPATWTLSNHDLVRPVTRYGGDEVGTRRARAMALVALALPGAVCLYNGEELGLPDVELPDEARRDPVWERSGRTVRGRDGCRVPLPWESTGPSLGFSPSADTWLPVPPAAAPQWAALSVEAQLEDPESTLSLYRRALELRRSDVAAGDELEWFGAPDGCFAFRRRDGGLVCALNTSDRPVPMPPGEVLLASGPLPDDESELPPDTAVWLS